MPSRRLGRRLRLAPVAVVLATCLGVAARRTNDADASADAFEQRKGAARAFELGPVRPLGAHPILDFPIPPMFGYVNSGGPLSSAVSPVRRGGPLSLKLPWHSEEAAPKSLAAVPFSWPAVWTETILGVELLATTPYSYVYHATLKEQVGDLPAESSVVVKERRFDYDDPLAPPIDPITKQRRELAMMQRFNGGDFLTLIRATGPEDWHYGYPMVIMMEEAAGTLKGLVLGKSLREVPMNVRIRLLRQMLRGVNTMHEQNMVHRDLKPENMFIVGDGVAAKPDSFNLKVGDFGLAVGLFGTGEPFEEKGTPSRAGTKDYFPPEINSKSGWEPKKQDAYAAGLIMCETVFGMHPKRCTSWLSLSELKEHRQAEKRFKDLISAMTVERPADRLGISDALKVLSEIADENGW